MRREGQYELGPVLGRYGSRNIGVNTMTHEIGANDTTYTIL